MIVRYGEHYGETTDAAFVWTLEMLWVGAARALQRAATEMQ